MDDRTREYLKGRFGDYYRRASPALPPDANLREWGHIPWTPGRARRCSGISRCTIWATWTRSSRTTRPVTRTSRPPATTIPARRRCRRRGGAPPTSSSTSTPTTSLASTRTQQPPTRDARRGKQALLRLLDFLEDDFSFDDLTVVFSGGRGYHVHVRDESVRELDSEARREVVDYVRAIDLDTEGLIRTVSERGTTKRVLPHRGRLGRASPRGPDRVRRRPPRDGRRGRPRATDGTRQDRRGTCGDDPRGLRPQPNPTAVREGNVEARGPGVRRRLVSALAARA